jgi:cobyrinic acid a,c-diamide synthase
MTHLPRLALATPESSTEPSFAALAWLAGLTQHGWRVQHFRSRACPTGTEVVSQFSGLPGRHLDAWLMPETVLRKLFLQGTRQADLALVEGTLDIRAAQGHAHFDQPGQLRPLIDALELPTVAVVTCPPRESFHLPQIPDDASAVFLDGLEHPDDFEFFQRMISVTTRKPVLGAVGSFPEASAFLREAPRDRPIPTELGQKLAASFLRFADLEGIARLAERQAFPACAPPRPFCCNRRFRVAYAHDEAFGGYFPDTLEALETLGAELVEFSPLRDEMLPPAVDLVMIGCGVPDRYADALAANLSLIASLRQHVCFGQRIYSEGGGTAYLGRSMILDDRCVPGAGILPFDAELLANPASPMPVARTLNRDCWIGPAGTVVRGYKSGRWQLRSGADPHDCRTCFGSLTTQDDVFYHHHAVGGLLHLHLGALAELVSAFAGPHPASLTLPSSRP